MNKRFNRRFRKASSNSHNSGNTGYYNRNSGGKISRLGKKVKSNYSNYREKLELDKRSLGQRIILVGLSGFTAGLMVLIVLSAFFTVFMPKISDLEAYAGGESTIFYDRNGKVLFSIHGDENREIIETDDIPDTIKQATVAIEDDRFYKHEGFDVPAIVKAVLSEFGVGSPRGGSTITQQLVKNTFLGPERTYTRKVKELILSVRTERNFTKDDILTMYLNQIPYGGTAYGVEKASEVFFDKDAKELTLAESAILAALPQAPTYYSPYGSHKYTTLDVEFTPEDYEKRKFRGIGDLRESEYTNGLLGKWYDLANGERIYLPGRVDAVLKRMQDLNYISEEEKNAARDEAINITFNEYKSNIKAPHFVFYVKELLEKEYGKEYVENAGLKVYTTLDLDLQKEAETMLAEQVVNNKGYGATNAALLSVDNSNGNVLAMVGSADYFNVDIDGNVNITTSVRQPGSSFKPIVYLTAFMNKYAPGTVIFDVPTNLGGQNPNNYDGSFWGPLTIRRALAQSRNIPAIKAYYLAGEQDAIIDTSEKMGIESLDRRVDYGWPLALGTGEVKMIEMVQAFSVLANNGTKVDINPILKIEDSNDKVIVDYTKSLKTKPVEVINPQVAYLVTDILSDTANNLGPRLNLSGREAAVKTGTSNKKLSNSEILPTNLWTIGYTPQITTAVWAGNSNGDAATRTASGYGAAAPLWNKYMNFAHKHLSLASKPFDVPTGLKSVQVSKLSGLLPGKNTPESMLRSDIFPSFSVPTEVDQSFSVRVSDTRNGGVPNEYCPSEFVKEVTYWNPRPVEDKFNWGAEVIAWTKNMSEEQKAGLGFTETLMIGSPSSEVSELCKKEFADSAPTVEIISHSELETVEPGTIKVQASVQSASGIEKVEYYFGSSFQQSVESPPYIGNIRVPGLALGQTFEIKVKAIDKNGYSTEKVMKLKIGEREEEDPFDDAEALINDVSLPLGSAEDDSDT